MKCFSRLYFSPRIRNLWIHGGSWKIEALLENLLTFYYIIRLDRTYEYHTSTVYFEEVTKFWTCSLLTFYAQFLSNARVLLHTRLEISFRFDRHNHLSHLLYCNLSGNFQMFYVTSVPTTNILSRIAALWTDTTYRTKFKQSRIYIHP